MNRWLFFALMAMSSCLRSQDAYELHVRDCQRHNFDDYRGSEQKLEHDNQGYLQATAPLYTINPSQQNHVYNTWVTTSPAHSLTLQPFYIDALGNPIYAQQPMVTSIPLQLAPPPYPMPSMQMPYETVFMKAKAPLDSEDSDCGCCIQ